MILVLERLAFQFGYPKKLRVDNWPAYTSGKLKKYRKGKRIEFFSFHQGGLLKRLYRAA